jgi:hypothetical protein
MTAAKSKKSRAIVTWAFAPKSMYLIRSNVGKGPHVTIGTIFRIKLETA